MASRFSISAVYKLIDQFTAPLKKMDFSAKAFTKGLKSDFASAQRQVRNFGEGVKRNAWIGITAAVAGLGYMAKEGIELASNLAEVQNVVDVSFGKEGAQKINSWSKTAITNFGLSELQAKKFNGTMGAMLKSSGLTGDQIVEMSTKLSGLAGDFASFYNLDTEEAFTKIRSGISGETEPLKQLGINMSVANLQAFALTQGIKKKFQAMTQAEQATLRYNYLMKVSSDAQGDFSRTLSTSLANQERVLKTKFGQKLAEVFQKLIPHLISAADSFSKWLDTLDTESIANFVVEIFKAFKTLFNIVVGLFNFLKPLSPIIFSIVGAFMAYKAALIVAAIAQGILNAVMTANPIGIIIVAIGALIGLIVGLAQNWDNVCKAMQNFWNMVVGVAQAVWNFLVKSLQDACKWVWETGDKFLFLAGPIGVISSVIIELAKNWDNIVSSFKNGDIIGGILKIGGTIFSALLMPIQSLLEMLSNIPGLGDLAKSGAAKIGEFRAFLSGQTGAENQAPVTPEERSATIREERTSRGELLIRDQTGRAQLSMPHGAPGYQIKMATSGGF